MKYLVAVYLCDRAYGGAEEGGWWYDTGELVRICKVFGNCEMAVAYAQRMNARLKATLNKGRYDIGSVLSTGQYFAEVKDDFAEKYYPECRPAYS